MTRTYVLVSGDFVKTGGMDRANHALASYLSGRGDEVHLVAFRVGGELLESPRVTWHRAAKPLGSYSLGRPRLDALGRKWAARMMPRGARVVVNGGNCRWGDVNWVHHINVLDVPAPGGRLLRRLKAAIDYRLHVAAERAALGEARLLITTCIKNRDDLIRQFGLPADRIEVVYYGADPEAFHPATPGERDELRRRHGMPADRPQYLFVGGLGADRRKGFDTLFAAWASLCGDATWDADLIVVGDGGERRDWARKAAEAGLGQRLPGVPPRRARVIPGLRCARSAVTL
jgi:glycosyltransferase involved in cell wall biosynthesis